MGRIRGLLALACVTALLVGCTDRDPTNNRAHRDSRDHVSEKLPVGFWFDAGFPAEGTKGLRRSEALDQEWLLPCTGVRLAADKHRVAAYGLQSSQGGDYNYLVDTRQLLVYDEASVARRAMDELASALKKCDDAMPTSLTLPDKVAALGEASITVEAVVPVDPPIDMGASGYGRKITRHTQRMLFSQQGAAILSTGIGHELVDSPEDFPFVWPSYRHLVVAEQLCAFDEHPCRLPHKVEGAPDSTLPGFGELFAGDQKVLKTTGSEAGGPTTCSQRSLASLGAISAVRHEYPGDAEKDPPAAILALAEFRDQESARRAQIHLNAALTDCKTGADLVGYDQWYGDDPCWVEVVPVPQGEALGCHGEYTTREAPPWDAGSQLPPRLIALDSAVLRVGRLVVLADLAAPATEEEPEELSPLLLRVLDRVGESLDSPQEHEPTYDGVDHVVPPVRLGRGLAHLAALRDPLVPPQTYDGCTDVTLRSGSTATVDANSRKVVAYRLGGADATPRGVSATATLEDAAAAYPEAERLDNEGYRSSQHQVLAHLPDGSNVRVMHDTDYERYTRVWLQGERCGDVDPIYEE